MHEAIRMFESAGSCPLFPASSIAHLQFHCSCSESAQSFEVERRPMEPTAQSVQVVSSVFSKGLPQVLRILR